MDNNCVEDIVEGDIKKLINFLTFSKFKKFKEREYYQRNKIKIKPCPHPDCDEWIRPINQDSIYSVCNDLHYYCIFCREYWKFNHKCIKVIKLFKQSRNLKN